MIDQLKRTALESPPVTDLRVIGVELTVERNGYVEEELEIFECRHTIPDAGDNRMNYSAPPVCFRVTLHTNRGDLTAYLSSRAGVVGPNRVF